MIKREKRCGHTGRVRLIKMIWLWKSRELWKRTRQATWHDGIQQHPGQLRDRGGAFHDDALKWMHPEVMQVARP